MTLEFPRTTRETKRFNWHRPFMDRPVHYKRIDVPDGRCITLKPNEAQTWTSDPDIVDCDVCLIALKESAHDRPDSPEGPAAT